MTLDELEGAINALQDDLDPVAGERAAGLRHGYCHWLRLDNARFGALGEGRTLRGY